MPINKVFLLLLLILVSLSNTKCNRKPSGIPSGEYVARDGRNVVNGFYVPTQDHVNENLNNMLSPPEMCHLNNQDPQIIYDTQHDSSFNGLDLPVVYPYSKKAKWHHSWTKDMYDFMMKDHEMQELLSGEIPIDDKDLRSLGCTGYKYATKQERAKFLILFMSSIAVRESSHRENVNAKGPHATARGLLQLGGKTILNHCKECRDRDAKAGRCIKKGRNNVANIPPWIRLNQATPNLRCGLRVLKNQLKGGISSIKPRLRGRLFPSKGSYWEVLMKPNQQKVVQRHFLAHAKKQLPFCQRRKLTTVTENGVNEITFIEKNQCEGVAEEMQIHCQTMSKIGPVNEGMKTCLAGLVNSDIQEKGYSSTRGDSLKELTKLSDDLIFQKIHNDTTK